MLPLGVLTRGPNPLDLVAAEERFGSWMTQYGYANEETRSNHKQFLFPRIAWRIQANAWGGLVGRLCW